MHKQENSLVTGGAECNQVVKRWANEVCLKITASLTQKYSSWALV